MGSQDFQSMPHYYPSNHPERPLSPLSTSSQCNGVNNDLTLFPSHNEQGNLGASTIQTVPSFEIPEYNTARSASPPSPSSFDRHSDSTTGHSVRNMKPPSPSYQRTPIDPSKVICLGPLPDNVQIPFSSSSTNRNRLPMQGISNQDPYQLPIQGGSLDPNRQPYSSESLRYGQRSRQASSTTHSRVPSQSSSKQVFAIDGHAFDLPPIPFVDRAHRMSTAETLGSNYTVEEEQRIARFGRMDGADIPHIPQPADKRYSWEE
jgi:hypothetical protein